MDFFCKSYENVPIWVFLHTEFISALKTEPKSMVFEKHAKNGKKIFGGNVGFFIKCALLLKVIMFLQNMLIFTKM